MKELFPHAGQLAAEFLGVLLAYPGEFFSPGELAATLRFCPSWKEYLVGFESDRGQPAAIGRYLNELGLNKSGHHRTRGSLYSSQATLTRLQQALDDARQARTSEAQFRGAPSDLEMTGGEADGAGDGVVAAVPLEMATELVAEEVSAQPAREERRRSGEVAVQGGAAYISPIESAIGSGIPSGASGAGAGAAPAPARTAPVIGWRRRATDLSRTPQRTAAAPQAGMPPLALPGYAGPPPEYAGGGAPPTWIGGSAAMPAGMPMNSMAAATSGALSGYPPGVLTPYGMPQFGAPPALAEEAGLPLSFYWIQIRRHLYKIILAAAVVTGLAAVYTLKIPKLYESVVTLRMDFRGADALALNNADGSGDSAFDPTTLIQTEVADVRQRGVVLDAITSAHLDQDVNLLKQIQRPGGAVPTTLNPSALDDSLVGLIQANMSAIPPDNTHNIDIHYKSLDPNTSASVANALADALISHEFQTRQQEQDQTLKFMNQQFSDITARMETEQAQLTEYQHQNNILNPDSQSNLENATLTTLNSGFLAAQAELNKYQAEQDVLKSGQVTDALLASDDGAVLRPTYDAWRAAQLKFDQTKATRGAANPEYQAAQQAVTLARQQLDTAIASVKNQIASQFAASQQREMLVAAQLQTARGAVQSFNDKAIDYNNQARALTADQKLHDDLETQIKQQQLSGSESSSSLRVTNRATGNPAPVYPNVRQNVMMAAMFSLFFGCGLAVLVGYLDRSFTSPEGVEQYLRIPLLGALPVITNKSNPIELAEAPSEEETAASGKPSQRSAFAEAVLMLRTAVLYSAPHGFRTLCVTSAQPQEGKSVILANLAISMALHGSKVLLIDGDIRRPTQHRIFEVGNQTGLSNVLRQTAPIEECFRATTVEKLYVMPAGPAVPNPSELMATMLAQVLGPLTAEFDYVLVDSPPVLGFADAVSISTVVEGTLLVARAGKTQRELVSAALQPLKRVRARVLGLVLNQVSSSLSPYYSYYRNHYARYYGGRDEDEAGERK